MINSIIKTILLVTVLSFLVTTSAQAEMYFNHDTGNWENSGASVVTESSQAVEIDVNQNIRALCMNKWGTDYKMVNYCIDKQETAYNDLSERHSVNAGSSVYEEILGSCMSKWRDNGLFDFAMVDYCASNQVKAYNSLHN